MAEARFREEINALMFSATHDGKLDVRNEEGWWIATVPDAEVGGHDV